MVVAHGHFSTLAPLLEGPLCLVEEEVGTFSHWLGLHGGESPWLAVSKSGAPHSWAARCLLVDISFFHIELKTLNWCFTL